MFEKIAEMINQYEKKGDFTHAEVRDEIIFSAEKRLGAKLPEAYQWFLKNYGQGGLEGIETFGIGKSGEMVFVDKTIQFRLYGLSSKMIMIENCDEWIYCLDTRDESVLTWSLGDKKYHPVYTSFYEYLADRTSDAIENM